uniref:Uncharacterized protein n=1 Tax=Rhizophora mucronata TaxID=61149 RepID=A0A2P2K0E6_RHIMU
MVFVPNSLVETVGL